MKSSTIFFIVSMVASLLCAEAFAAEQKTKTPSAKPHTRREHATPALTFSPTHRPAERAPSQQAPFSHKSFKTRHSGQGLNGPSAPAPAGAPLVYEEPSDELVVPTVPEGPTVPEAFKRSAKLRRSGQGADSAATPAPAGRFEEEDDEVSLAKHLHQHVTGRTPARRKQLKATAPTPVSSPRQRRDSSLRAPSAAPQHLEIISQEYIEDAEDYRTVKSKVDALRLAGKKVRLFLDISMMHNDSTIPGFTALLTDRQLQVTVVGRNTSDAALLSAATAIQDTAKAASHHFNNHSATFENHFSLDDDESLFDGVQKNPRFIANEVFVVYASEETILPSEEEEHEFRSRFFLFRRPSEERRLEALHPSMYSAVAALVGEEDLDGRLVAGRVSDMTRDAFVALRSSTPPRAHRSRVANAAKPGRGQLKSVAPSVSQRSKKK